MRNKLHAFKLKLNQTPMRIIWFGLVGVGLGSDRYRFVRLVFLATSGTSMNGSSSLGYAPKWDVEVRINQALECSICLDLFENPKMLSCTHEFCKRCLEDILTFKKDGSAIITCPLRCDNETILSSQQTAHDLAASYTTKNVLETLHWVRATTLRTD